MFGSPQTGSPGYRARPVGRLTMNRQTTLAKNYEVPRNWVHIDATDQVLGRLAVRIASILLGKNKPEYTPHHDVGDFLVVTNASKIRITGNKLDQKFFQTYSGYPSGQKRFSYRWMLENKPELLLERAVRRMMPRNKLARHQLAKLKTFAGAEHPHQAQAPKTLELQTA
jgi:large subunit ribosomal protein L13